ncbi:TlpA disulfide reductase family protein [Dysgonomonas sp. 216]|uniref:TlpA disulfide reductase family protein n=1 Tax=Dysgonomonas sp. 216 TaxID=2302934 RepID=UPI0013D6BFD2|nr:TlpA disulfide reductase family protein [Dysgonomonas sp. 216]
MKKLSFLLILPFFVQLSCQDAKKQAGNDFTLTVKISNELFNGHYAYLTKMNDDLESFVSLDSIIIKNNEFVFKGKAINDSLVARYIFLGNIQNTRSFDPDLMFIPESGNIEMIVDSNGYPTLSGSPENDRLNELQKIKKEVVLTIKKRKGESKDNGNSVQLEEMAALAEKINDTLCPYLKSIVGSPLFDEIYVKNYIFLNVSQKKELYVVSGKRLLEKAKNDSIKQEEEKKKRGYAIIGKPFYELTCTDLTGRDVKLSQYVGKGRIVLLDFWASACRPCRQEFPLMKEFYTKYNGDGFEIINISTDSNESAWKKAVDQDQLVWTQLLSKKGKDSARSIYGINSIPHTVLIDREGIVVAKNIRGEEIEEEIKKLINNEKK